MKQYLINDSQRTISIPRTTPSQPSDIDLMLRIKTSREATDTIQVTIAETKSFSQYYTDYHLNNSIIKFAFQNCWKLVKYQRVYIDYITGGVSESEFINTARSYAHQFAKIEKTKLAKLASIILSTLGEPIDSADLSELLDADPHEIEDALISSHIIKSIGE